MLWLFIISLILLVGFEMNAAVHKAKMDIRELNEE
jgi:membrane protein